MSNPYDRFDFGAQVNPYDQFDQPAAPGADPLADAAHQSLLGFNRGLNAIVGLPGEIASFAANAAGFPETAKSLRWNNRLSRAVTRPDIQPRTTAGRVAEAAGTAVGASALPSFGVTGAAIRSAAPAAMQAPPATALVGALRDVGRKIAANPAAAVRADASAAALGGVGAHAAAANDIGPAGQAVAGVFAGMIPSLSGMAARGTVDAVRRARLNQGKAGAYGSMADDIQNIDDFAQQVATGPTTQNAATSRRTLDVLGDEMVRHNGDATAAREAAIARMVREDRVSINTARDRLRRLSQAHADNDLMFSEYPAVARSNNAIRATPPDRIDLDDVRRVDRTQSQATLDYLANNGNARSAMDVRNAIGERHEALGASMNRTLDDIGPRHKLGPQSSRPATIHDVQDMIEHTRNLGRQEYQTAYSSPVNQRVALQHLPRLIQGWEWRAAGRSGDVRRAMDQATRQFYLDTPNGPVLMMELQQLQDARGVLRGQMEAYARQGRNDLAGAVRPIYQSMTRLMQRMSPEWARANRRWGDLSYQQRAQEFGEAFATRAGPRYREHVQEFRQMAPQAQNIIRVEFLQQLRDKIDNLGDAQSVARLFSTQHARNMIRDLFGSDAAIRFSRAVRDQQVAVESERMLANSATHRRGIAQKQKDIDPGVNSAIENASLGGLRRWVLEMGRQLLTERRNRPLAEIATTPMRDVAKVAEHIARMRQQQIAVERSRSIPAQQQPRPFAGVAGAGTAPLLDIDVATGEVSNYRAR